MKRIRLIVQDGKKIAQLEYELPEDYAENREAVAAIAREIRDELPRMIEATDEGKT